MIYIDVTTIVYAAILYACPSPKLICHPLPPKKNKKEKLLIVKHRMDVDMTIWLSTMGQDMVHDAPLKILARLSTNE